MNVQLIVNDRMFPVHYELLTVIAECVPEGTHYRRLVKALAALNVPSITSRLLEAAGESLDQEDLDSLWASSGLDIRRSLVKMPRFVERLTDAQAQDIINTDDLKMLKSLANWPHLLYPAEGKSRATRLSGAMADTLLEHLAHSRYPEVCQTLADEEDTPFKFRPVFRECVEDGISVEKVFPTILPEDIELLETVPIEALQTIAYNVERIGNREARKAVIGLLCKHPDPSVRFELARNTQAPKWALELLLRDIEPDVSQTARESLGLDEDDDEGESHV